MNATSCNLTVLRQETVAEDIMRLTVQWQDRSREPHAGQFYMLRAWAADATPILSRPISVDDFDNQTGALTFLYQVKETLTDKEPIKEDLYVIEWYGIFYCGISTLLPNKIYLPMGCSR